MMLNKKPIFINGFARGGSNIIMNLLLSHPEVCISSGETHKVFKGTKWDSNIDVIKKRLFYDLPIRLLSGQDIFNINSLKKRKTISPFLQRYIDKILFEGRFTARLSTHNLYKYDNIPYTKEEIENCRLLTKGLNGVVYTVDIFNQMYPDAVFFGLVRNGLAICEGYVRRGVPSIEIGRMYKKIAKKLLSSNTQIENSHLVFYEDMVKDPLGFMRQIYSYANLDMGKVKKVRLQSKKMMGTDGKRKIHRGTDREVFWYELSEFHKFISPDINENQIKKLSKKDKSIFLSVAGDEMEELGYNIR